MWTKRDWTRAGAAAALSFGMTTAAFWPAGATAKDPATAADIAVPTLRFDKFTVTARLAESPDATVTVKPGDVPKLRIEVTNTGTSVQSAVFTADAMNQRVKLLGSRVAMPTRSEPQWMKSFALKVQPGETQVIDTVPNITLDAATSMTINLTAGKTAVTALRLRAIGPSTQPATQPTVAVVGTLPLAVAVAANPPASR